MLLRPYCNTTLSHQCIHRSNTMSSNKAVITASFLAGFAAASFLRLLDKRKISAKNRLNAGAGPEKSDSSLFWGDVNSLTEIPQKNKFLPAELYSQMVRDCVVCCVDCLVVRFNPLARRKECLLIKRASDPAKVRYCTLCNVIKSTETISL